MATAPKRLRRLHRDGPGGGAGSLRRHAHGTEKAPAPGWQQRRAAEGHGARMVTAPGWPRHPPVTEERTACAERSIHAGGGGPDRSWRAVTWVARPDPLALSTSGSITPPPLSMSPPTRDRGATWLGPAPTANRAGRVVAGPCCVVRPDRNGAGRAPPPRGHSQAANSGCGSFRGASRARSHGTRRRLASAARGTGRHPPTP